MIINMINGDHESSHQKKFPSKASSSSSSSRHRIRQPSIKTSHFKDCAVGRRSSEGSIGHEVKCPVVKSYYTFGTKTNLHAHDEKNQEGGLPLGRDSDNMPTSLTGLGGSAEKLPSNASPSKVKSILEKCSGTKQSLSDQKACPLIYGGMSQGFMKGMITTFESEGDVIHPTKYAGLKREIIPRVKTESRGDK
jgi:hypothetical protein